MEPSHFVAVAAILGLLITWSGTLVGVMIWLNNRFAKQDEDRNKQFHMVSSQFNALPKEFESTRHTMYGVMATTATDLKDVIEKGDAQINKRFDEWLSEFKDLRKDHREVENRVRQLELLRVAEKTKGA